MMMPHSAIAEQGLLGLIMCDNSRYDVVAERLTIEDFYVPMHAVIYKTAGELISSRMEANPISISEKMDCGAFGGQNAMLLHFTEMYDAASRADDVSTLAFIVSEHAYQRKLIVAAGELTKAANENRVEDAKGYQAIIAELSQTFSNQRPENPNDQLRKALSQSQKTDNMMKTGIYAWDNNFQGVFKGSRYIIAGHGGAGKSALAINMSWNMACDGKKVRWLSYEEETHALWWRIMARVSGVPYTAFRHGLSEDQRYQVSAKQDILMDKDFLAFYNIPTPSDMINACGQCDLVVLDGITSAPAEGATNKIEKAGVVTEYCARIAAKTGAAVIMLAHVNSDSVKTGASMTGIYGGQAATFDPEGIVDLRYADEDRSAVAMKVLKNRYGPAKKDVDLLRFNYERMEVL